MTATWPASVLIGEHSQYRGLLVELARQFNANGARVHWICATEQERAYYEGNFGHLFASVTVANKLYDATRMPVENEAAVFETARRYEKEYDTTVNALALTDRHLGRGYALAGHRHPRSRISENTSYAAMVHAFNELIGFWERRIDECGAQLVVNCGKVSALVGRRRNVPYRQLVGSRYSNFHYWAVNEFFENPDFKRRYDEIAGQGGALKIAEPYATHRQMRSWITKQLTLKGTIKDILLATARHQYWRFRGFEKAKGYLLGETVGYMWRRYSDLRELSHLTRPLDTLQGRRFVFYPLHTEPEAAVQMLSPEYFYQLSSIAALSRDLPAGTMLAVKETLAGVGRRPRDFYRQLADFKNVVLLDTAEHGLNVVAKASAVATITGTAGFEGAVLGKPVITFGQHNIYNFLDHVKVLRTESELAPYLAYALSDEFDHAKAESDGKRFLQAIIDCSVDLKDFSVIHPDKSDSTVVEEAIELLVNGLELTE